MKYIEIEDTDRNHLLINIDNILYCSESVVYDPTSSSSYIITKIVFNDETFKNVPYSINKVKSLIDSL